MKTAGLVLAAACIAVLAGLGTRTAELLDYGEQIFGVQMARGIGDRHGDARPGCGDRAEQDAERPLCLFGLLSCGGRSVATCLQPVQRLAQLRDLPSQAVRAGVLIIQDADQVVLAQIREIVGARVLMHLHDDGESEQRCEDGDDHERGQPDRAAPGRCLVVLRR